MADPVSLDDLDALDSSAPSEPASAQPVSLDALDTLDSPSIDFSRLKAAGKAASVYASVAEVIKALQKANPGVSTKDIVAGAMERGLLVADE